MPVLPGAKYCKDHISNEPLFTPIIPSLPKEDVEELSKKSKEMKISEEKPKIDTEVKEISFDTILISLNKIKDSLSSEGEDNAELNKLIDTIMNNEKFSSELKTNMVIARDEEDTTLTYIHKLINLFNKEKLPKKSKEIDKNKKSKKMYTIESDSEEVGKKVGGKNGKKVGKKKKKKDSSDDDNDHEEDDDNDHEENDNDDDDTSDDGNDVVDVVDEEEDVPKKMSGKKYKKKEEQEESAESD
jgi:hypothetical protein